MAPRPKAPDSSFLARLSASVHQYYAHAPAYIPRSANNHGQSMRERERESPRQAAMSRLMEMEGREGGGRGGESRVEEEERRNKRHGNFFAIRCHVLSYPFLSLSLSLSLPAPGVYKNPGKGVRERERSRVGQEL